MSSVLVWLFWIWLGASVVVLVRRRVTGKAAATPAPPDAVAADGAVPANPTDDPIAAFLANSAAAAAGEPPVAAEPSAGPAPERTPEPVGVATAVGPSPGLDEPVLAPVDRKAPRSAPAAGIADALVGIRMPCDLVPLVMDRLSSRRVTLSTTGHPAEVVGTALADELERLGYSLRPLSDRELIATRGVTELRLSINPPGADGRHLDHPNARDDAVVVEIALS